MTTKILSFICIALVFVIYHQVDESTKVFKQYHQKQYETMILRADIKSLKDSLKSCKEIEKMLNNDSIKFIYVK